MVQPIVITLVTTRMSLKVLRMASKILIYSSLLSIFPNSFGLSYIRPFMITSFFPSIMTVSSSFGLKGKALSVTRELGRLMLCLDPTLYIFTLASFTMYIHKYVIWYIKIYIHTAVYTKV